MKTVLLDIMLDNKFICQLKYTRHGHPEMIDGNIVEVYRETDIKEFVEQSRPSLIGKDFKIEFSTQKVL